MTRIPLDGQFGLPGLRRPGLGSWLRGVGRRGLKLTALTRRPPTLTPICTFRRRACPSRRKEGVEHEHDVKMDNGLGARPLSLRAITWTFMYIKKVIEAFFYSGVTL